jgi:hypothetical protein
MSKLTRRGAVAVILAGVAGVSLNTGAFASSKAKRGTDIGVGTQSAALLAIKDVDGDFDVSAEPHEIVVTNQTESQLKITVESQNQPSQYKFTTSRDGPFKDSITVPEGQSLEPGTSTNDPQASGGIFVSTDETGPVTETIEFNATSKSGSVNIKAFQEITLKNESEKQNDNGNGNGNGNDNGNDDDNDNGNG